MPGACRPAVAASLELSNEQGSVFASEVPLDPVPEDVVSPPPLPVELPVVVPALVAGVGNPLPPTELLHAATPASTKARPVRTTTRFTTVPCSLGHRPRIERSLVAHPRPLARADVTGFATSRKALLGVLALLSELAKPPPRGRGCSSC